LRLPALRGLGLSSLRRLRLPTLRGWRLAALGRLWLTSLRRLRLSALLWCLACRGHLRKGLGELFSLFGCRYGRRRGGYG
jgi:hypothetical protein